jgi:hypothetical protein
MDVTDEGIVTPVKLLQPQNALFPIVVTEGGIVTLVKLSQKENARLLIDITEDGMAYVPCFPIGYVTMVCIDLSNRTPFTLV